VSAGDTAFMIFSSALVMLMTPALGHFYCGLSDAKSIYSALMMAWGCVIVVSVQWYCFGYSLAFADASRMIGSFENAGFTGLGARPSSTYGAGAPSLLFAVFEMMFAVFSPSIMAGAVIGRARYMVFMLFVLLWTTFVYDFVAHWLWSNTCADGSRTALGWLKHLGAVDYAGALVVHASAGCSSLVLAIMVGSRQAKYPAHSVCMAMLALMITWFAWFGFNAGSAQEPNGMSVYALVNTHLSACAGFGTGVLLSCLYRNDSDAVTSALGAIAGLVTITGGAGLVQPWAALIYGALGSLVSFYVRRWRVLAAVDDTLDCFALHGVPGMLGALLTGLFATKDVGIVDGAFYGEPALLWKQLVAILSVVGYSCVCSFLILVVLDAAFPLRVRFDEEIEGIDAAYHGGVARETPPVSRHMPPDAPMLRPMPTNAPA
jgi:Amt family ammonium transporter